jgi:triacylglycerol esterase/lipase EstA (alpha/beta hydrolase family)
VGEDLDASLRTRPGIQALIRPSQRCNTGADGRLAVVEGSLLERGEPVDGRRERCEGARHAGAGAAGSTLTFSLDTWTSNQAADVTIRGPDGRVLLDGVRLREGDTWTWTLPESGEFLVDLQPLRGDARPNDYGLTMTCTSGCDLPYTRYPLFFMHGAMGTDSFLGILDYWYQVREPLEDAGYTVYMPAATAVAGVAERGEEWADAIDAVVASGVARKVNLIGHSQGGLDARYVVAGLGYSDKVASVTTIATPHRGTVAADLAAGVIGLGPFDGALLDEVVGGLIGIIGLQGDELTQQLDDLTRDGAEGFNQAYPDDPDVVYRSWAGRTCRALDFFCQWDNNGEVVDLTLALAYELTVWNEGPNDGLVSVASSEWGEYQGALPADHLDQVGQIADPFVGPFDHVQFFLDEAATLRERGF